ncbi:hypothetical protein OMP43_17380 [Sphingomonas sp. CBMAI 2297]|uniref:hypothetical protein n=1 Tax=Sphingomonas sp. CBMAI 2297 TaxID=2991720 RepID=UPI002455DEB0|nr:hypothetical protein [Sphingomonas sp. CBMAI 2297]MDH4745800.1 hypothetical protein [Sphingomonas sp. CBMAI 2297]
MAAEPTLFEKVAVAVARAEARGRPIGQIKAPKATVDEFNAGMQVADPKLVERICGIVIVSDQDDDAPFQAYDADGAPMATGDLFA